MVDFSHFYELCGCKDLGEIQLEHGCKLLMKCFARSLNDTNVGQKKFIIPNSQ